MNLVRDASVDVQDVSNVANKVTCRGTVRREVDGPAEKVLCLYASALVF